MDTGNFLFFFFISELSNIIQAIVLIRFRKIKREEVGTDFNAKLVMVQRKGFVNLIIM